MIVLDTHAWIWWVSDPRKLSAKARRAIDYAKAVGLCPISCWELSTKVAHGKLTLDRELHLWVRQALGRPPLQVLDLSPDIAVAAGQLGREGFHGDPVDRLIVATALHHGAELVTKDEKILAFPKVRGVW